VKLTLLIAAQCIPYPYLPQSPHIIPTHSPSDRHPPTLPGGPRVRPCAHLERALSTQHSARAQRSAILFGHTNVTLMEARTKKKPFPRRAILNDAIYMR
jgi:hypothetical protein